MFGNLFLEYMAEHPEIVLKAGGNPTDREELLWYVDRLPKDAEQMLFEQAVATYSLPEIDGEYDFEKSLALSMQDADYFHKGSVSSSVYLYRATEFENTIRQKIAQYQR